MALKSEASEPNAPESEVPPNATALALDIGGTKLAAGIVTGAGELLVSRRTPTADATDGEELFGRLCDLAEDVVEEWRDFQQSKKGKKRSEEADWLEEKSNTESGNSQVSPIVIGVGCGGPMRDGNRLVSPLNIAVWRDFPLGERLSQRFSLPVAVENDAKALALGEGWRGAAQGVANYIAMVVSTGIGGGIVLEGRLLHGADNNAGHIGHVFVEPDGRADAAGARGNLEGQASGLAIAEITGHPPADASDEVRRQVGEYVGRAVASVANLLDLQLALVSGSVALGYGEIFFKSAQETIDKLCKIDFSRGTRIIPGGLGEDGPLIGAAAVGFQELGYSVLLTSQEGF